MKKILDYLVRRLRRFEITTVSWCILYAASSVFVQQAPEDLVRNYKIKFPIIELGNCANYGDCRSYCEDPLNKNACEAYAKEKGFYEGPEIEKEKEVIVDTAKKELGCDSHESCKTLCEQKENFEKCNSFAQKNKLFGGYHVDPGAGKVLEKAKAVLGCNSYETCKTYCEQEGNADLCTQFARKLGIRGGAEAKGPGNCTSDVTCKAYCSNPSNFAECARFTSSIKTAEFRGPGGCDSIESCKAHCDKNPRECYGYSLLPYTPSDSISACTKIAGCTWTGSGCQCIGNIQDPSTTCKQTPGCSWTGNSCKCSTTDDSQANTNFVDPVATCNRLIGCSWTGVSCQCSSLSTTTDPIAACIKVPGCKWNNYSCDCSQQTDRDFATECQKNSSCSWNSDLRICECPNYPRIGISPYPTSYPNPTLSSTPVSTSTSCSGGQYWNGSSCLCPSGQTWNGSSCSSSAGSSSGSSSCQEPSGGCGSNYYWESGSCSCKYYSYLTPSSYSYPSPSSGYSYPSPSSGTYGTPSYGTPSYGTPSYGTPSYGTPESYGTPSGGDAKSMCEQTSGCTWTGTACECSHGASTKRNWLQLIIDYLSIWKK